MIKQVICTFAAMSTLVFIQPAAAQFPCKNPYGCTKTSVLWSYGVPGLAVDFYRHQCEQQSDGGAKAYLAVRPGQIPGSNVVTCYYQQTIRKGG